MKTAEKENPKNDDNVNLQADALSDLPVAERQADEIKGGDLFMNFKFTDRHNPQL